MRNAILSKRRNMFFASKSLSAEQTAIHVRLGEVYLVALRLLLNLNKSIQSSPTGNHKVAQRYRPVFARGPVITGDWRRATLCISISNSVAASVLYSKQRCVYALRNCCLACCMRSSRANVFTPPRGFQKVSPRVYRTPARTLKRCLGKTWLTGTAIKVSEYAISNSNV